MIRSYALVFLLSLSLSYGLMTCWEIGLERMEERDVVGQM